MPVITDVVGLSLNGGVATVEREIGGGSREVVDMPLPGVIGATRGLNEPRYPKLPDILKAKKKEVKPKQEKKTFGNFQKGIWGYVQFVLFLGLMFYMLQLCRGGV